ncbi:MAG TPA: sulfotransferase [Woeseiaceae bacterium]|nr:sulfotransferase [Woeseiaceae bacterium]
MATQPDFAQAFQYARDLQARGSLRRAERKLEELLERGENRELVLGALVELCLEARRFDEAVARLVALTEEDPDRLFWFARLGAVLERLGRLPEAIAHYERLLSRNPGLGDAWYNLARLLRKEKRYGDAMAAYEKALALDVERPHEVLSNMGVLWSEMQRPEEAETAYRRALELEPGYVPALFNLGGLCEETGDRERAAEYHRKVLALEPHHSGALARLVHAERIASDDDPRLRAVEQALAAGADPAAAEELLFARGKALDDLDRCREAFETFARANALGAQRNPRYDPAVTERAFDRLIGLVDAEWLARNTLESAHSPVFICGMFRSGSTLVEQILAAHPAVTAGGELELLPWLALRELGSWPQGAANVSRTALAAIAEGYMAHVRELFPDAARVTDKRPDNFLYLGLIRALFPKARIVYTVREAADNCLSIWFQHLGTLSYATDLAHVAHYYRQHERLMAHWRELLGDALYTVQYEALVADPEPVVRDLLDFLGLEWDERCLAFRDAARPVRTASVWQVREPLHSRSVGRWRRYEPYLRGIDGPWRGTQAPPPGSSA